jgi:hypothetical protein
MMTKAEFVDQPPAGAALTAYDQAHAKLYVRLLDAESHGADWREVVQLLFNICPVSEPERASLVYSAHLARAKWMAENGFRQLLSPRLN